MSLSRLPKIIINAANLKKGGALQVAASFVCEAAKINDIEFYVILGKASSKVISPSEFEGTKHLKFLTIDIHPAESIFQFFKFRSRLSKIEAKIRPYGVISVFGPSYWKPEALHIVGFARPYIIYENTYFFKVSKHGKKLRFKILNRIHKYFFRKESSLYWTETIDSRQRLSEKIGKPLDHIVVATNNCSNFFRNANIKPFPGLPEKKAPRLLYISSYYNHKGFEQIPPILNKLAERNIEIELILTIDACNFERLFAAYPNVINLGQVEPQYCPYLYEVSDIVFAPTLLEVFSAIYPEAMYSQKPIVTTDLPFARNICGDAALYFDPASPEDAASKIQHLLNDPDLRNKLVAKGLERVGEFDLPEERFRKILDMLLKSSEY